MNRQQVTEEIKDILGQVPGFIDSMPDDTLEYEWGLFKRFELQETSIPPKYRELMGITAATMQHCWYCSNFHKAMAQMHGATDAEIQEAVHFAKFTSGWSNYLNGMLYDKEVFLNELNDIGKFVMSHPQTN